MSVKRVVVTGSGIAPAMAAIAIRRAFARGGVEVEWVETPDMGSPHRTVSGLPNLRAFHRLLRVSESEVLEPANGCFALARHYAGFSPGLDWWHSYGPIGRPFQSLPFAQYWIKAHGAGMPAAFDHFGREAVACRNGRIWLSDGPSGAAVAYGYHLDAAGYAALVHARALKEGVTIVRDAVPAAVVERGRVSAVRLSSGRRIAGDLFVDAQGAIRAALGDDDRVDAAVSSCDRLLTGSAPVLDPKPLYTRVTAHRAGWSALTPLQDRTGVTVAYDSSRVSDGEAIQLAGAPLIGEPDFAQLKPFRRTAPWAGNVVAIGDAAEMVEPLGGFDLHRVQIACAHLVSLWPVDAGAMPEGEIYNEEVANFQARLADFDVAQYGLSRRDEPFWQAARARPRSPELDARISLFAARGMIIEYNQDSFAADEWQALLIGAGVMPRSYDPQVDRVDEQAIMMDFQSQLGAIQADVMAMATHEVALAWAMLST